MFPLYGLYAVEATVATALAFAGPYLHLRKKLRTTQLDPFEDEPNKLHARNYIDLVIKIVV